MRLFSFSALRSAAPLVPAAVASCLVLLPAPASAQAPEAARVAAPASPARSDEVAAWRASARERIRNQWLVPQEAPPTARVELDVALLPSGYSADVSTRRSSGIAEFDSAARRAVLAAMPLTLPAEVGAYERTRRFGAIFEANGGVQLVDVHTLAPPLFPPIVPPLAPLGAAVPAPAPPERFVCGTASVGPPVAPDCSYTGSRNALLTCFVQAVQKRAARLVSACAASAYPLEARRNRWEGTVEIALSFVQGGRPLGVSVAQTSGQPLLDQRALEIVQAALVAPPAELYATAFSVRVPMVFRMRQVEGK